jgi:hypothetical protein
LTSGSWFDYLGVIGKASWEDALRGYLKEMILEDAWGKVPKERCFVRAALGKVL